MVFTCQLPATQINIVSFTVAHVRRGMPSPMPSDISQEKGWRAVSVEQEKACCLTLVKESDGTLSNVGQGNGCYMLSRVIERGMTQSLTLLY